MGAIIKGVLKKPKAKSNLSLLQSQNKAQPNSPEGGIFINDYTHRVLAPTPYADYNPMLGDI